MDLYLSTSGSSGSFGGGGGGGGGGRPTDARFETGAAGLREAAALTTGAFFAIVGITGGAGGAAGADCPGRGCATGFGFGLAAAAGLG